MVSSGLISESEVEDKKSKLLERDLWGVDVGETLVQFCQINLIVQGDGYQNIYKSDALDKNQPLLKNELNLMWS